MFLCVCVHAFTRLDDDVDVVVFVFGILSNFVCLKNKW